MCGPGSWSRYIQHLFEVDVRMAWRSWSRHIGNVCVAEVGGDVTYYAAVTSEIYAWPKFVEPLHKLFMGLLHGKHICGRGSWESCLNWFGLNWFELA